MIVNEIGASKSSSAETVEHPDPVISVGTNGLITATHTQSSGNVAGGTTTATHQLTTQAGKTVTPSTTSQTAVVSGRYATGNVIVAGSANLTPGNIKSGVDIFGVVGTYGAGGGELAFGTVNGSGEKSILIPYTGDNYPSILALFVNGLSTPGSVIEMITSATVLFLDGGAAIVSYQNLSGSPNPPTPITVGTKPNETTCSVVKQGSYLLLTLGSAAETFLYTAVYAYAYV